jgi:hypothetical protein
VSEKALRRAARAKRPGLDLGHCIVMMLMADRAGDDGRFSVADDDAFLAELTAEVNAVEARLAGDPFVRSGIDNDRVNRVVAAYQEAQDEEK